MIDFPQAARASLPLLLVLGTACGSPVEFGAGRVEQGVVYGNDDRQELYLAPDELRRLGEQSVVALVDEASLDGLPPTDPHAAFSAPTWRERSGLCDGVRFEDEPSAAVCSGVLVDADLVLTAGHCARNLDCNVLSLVFGYDYRDDGAIPELGDDDIYHCAEIPSFQIPSLAGALDYGWIRLDRPVSADKRPLAIESERAALDVSSPLQAFNFGGGVPLKVQTDVPIADARADTLDYFVTALDAFEGASGGPLIRNAGVLGILVHGNGDYLQNQTGCNDIAVLPESAAGERATYAFQALSGLCQDAPASTSLCAQPRIASAKAGCSIGAASQHGFPWWAPVIVCVALALRRISRHPTYS